MVGSFVRTLNPEMPRARKVAAHAKPVVNQPQRVAQTKPTVTQAPPAVESALSQALAMVAVALAAQPATSASPAAIVPADIAAKAPEQNPLELFLPAAAGETARTEPPATVPPPSPPPSPSSPNPLAGRWGFDQRLGWLWLPENSSSVVIVPVIEVFPGGLITIHPRSRTAASRTARQSDASPLPFQPRKGSVIQHDAPGSTRKPATSLIPNKN